MNPIIKYRADHGLTLEGLAKRLQVSTSTAYNWQKNPSRIPIYKVARIAKALSVKPQDLRPDL
jgi:transcriptional regulator with XRE-family HTH domain